MSVCLSVRVSAQHKRVPAGYLMFWNIDIKMILVKERALSLFDASPTHESLYLYHDKKSPVCLASVPSCV